MAKESTQTPEDTGADDAEEQDVADFGEAFDKLNDEGEMPEDMPPADDTPPEDGTPPQDEPPADVPPPGDTPPEGTPPEETPEQKVQRLAEENQKAQAAQEWWKDVRRLHPDAEEVCDTPEFKSWLKAQDDATRNDANGSAAAAASVLGKFKAQQANPAEKGTDKQKAATPTEAQDLAQFLDANPDLASQEIEFVDQAGITTKGTLKEFLTEKGYPDVFAAMWRVTQAAIQKAQGAKQDATGTLQAAIDKALADKGYVTRKDIDGIAKKLLDLDVIQAHNDAPRIVASKEFKDWKAKQPAPIQKLAAGTAEEQIAILDLYKQGTGGGEAAERKAARGKLRTNTLRRGQRTGVPRETSAMPDNEEEEQAKFAEKFDEMAHDLDKE